MEVTVRAGKLGLETSSQGQALLVHSRSRDTVRTAHVSMQAALL